MHVVGFLVVDVHIGAADVDPAEVVLAHIFFPLVYVTLEAYGIDLEGPVGGCQQRVVEHLQRRALFLAVVAVGVPEPQYDVFGGEPMAADPILRVAALVGVGHPQLLSVGTDEALPYALVVVAHVVLRAFADPRATALEVIVLGQMAPHSVPADILR